MHFPPPHTHGGEKLKKEICKICGSFTPIFSSSQYTRIFYTRFSLNSGGFFISPTPFFFLLFLLSLFFFPFLFSFPSSSAYRIFPHMVCLLNRQHKTTNGARDLRDLVHKWQGICVEVVGIDNSTLFCSLHPLCDWV